MKTQSRITGSIAVTAAAASLLALAFGIRAVMGMFISPLNSATGLGFATISFALALSQLVAGVAQPVFGVLADRYGPARIVFAGGLLLAAGLALVPLSASALGIACAFGILAAAYAAVGSTPTLLGAVNRRVPAQHRGLATGIVSAGGSVGQFVVSPLTQVSIAALGWIGSLYVLVLLALVALPLSRAFSGASPAAENPSTDRIDVDQGACAALLGATRDYRYWCLAAGFFVCGFHVSFLLVHMPGVIELCGAPMSTTGLWLALLGLSNVAGSIISGWR